MALLLTSTETRQTIIIGGKNTRYCPKPAEEVSEPAELKSIQNQLFKLREGETHSGQASVYPAVNL